MKRAEGPDGSAPVPPPTDATDALATIPAAAAEPELAPDAPVAASLTGDAAAIDPPALVNAAPVTKGVRSAKPVRIVGQPPLEEPVREPAHVALRALPI